MNPMDASRDFGLNPDLAVTALWITQLAYSVTYMQLAAQAGISPPDALQTAEDEASSICDTLGATPEIRAEVLQCFQMVREQNPRWRP